MIKVLIDDFGTKIRITRADFGTRKVILKTIKELISFATNKGVCDYEK